MPPTATGRRVDRIPGQDPLTRPRHRAKPHQRRSRVDPTRIVNGASPTEVSDSAASTIFNPARTARSGIILVRHRNPEHPHHRVPDELLHRPAEPLDVSAGHREVRRQHRVHIFWIRRLRRRREPHQIAEQRRDDLALLTQTPSRSSQRGASTHHRSVARRGSHHHKKGTAPSGDTIPHNPTPASLTSRPPSVALKPWLPVSAPATAPNHTCRRHCHPSNRHPTISLAWFDQRDTPDRRP